MPQIVRAVRVPVIAAGGIADAQGVAAALALYEFPWPSVSIAPKVDSHFCDFRC
jgi:hypothetical protein